jgi:hypothetical protein
MSVDDSANNQDKIVSPLLVFTLYDKEMCIWFQRKKYQWTQKYYH